MKRELELYIHIPFCVRKCGYCDFLSAPASAKTRAEYLEALKQEILESGQLGREYQVSTLFFGGGTPSILEEGQIPDILEVIRKVFRISADAEITVECNPGTLTEKKLKAYKSGGVNRLSIGLQSAQKEELRLLGRIHTFEDFLESFSLARKMGFSNINVDLMSALPGQTKESWQDTLAKVLALEPEHISAYSLILEEGTPFFEQYGKEPARLPDEDTERWMYYETRRELEAAGYCRYEISNYAKPGRECRHNLGYWRRTEYKGFGIGAASLLKNCRCRNGSSLEAYLQRQFSAKSREILTPAEILSEEMFLGLRIMEGVRLTGQMRRVYDEALKRHISQGLLTEEKGYLRLTERGIDVSNWVLADFLLDADEEIG